MIRLLRDHWNRWSTYHRVRNELSQRSDIELGELQVIRSDIDRVAWRTAFGRGALSGRAGLGG